MNEDSLPTRGASALSRAGTKISMAVSQVRPPLTVCALPPPASPLLSHPLQTSSPCLGAWHRIQSLSWVFSAHSQQSRNALFSQFSEFSSFKNRIFCVTGCLLILFQVGSGDLSSPYQREVFIGFVELFIIVSSIHSAAIYLASTVWKENEFNFNLHIYIEQGADFIALQTELPQIIFLTWWADSCEWIQRALLHILTSQ